MKSKEFDKLFDEGKDITHLLDMSTARRPNQELKRVNVDFPLWMRETTGSGIQTPGSHAPVHHQDLAG